MTRINFILLLVLVCCALSVVTSQHQARKSFIELQTEKDREARLDQEWRELQIESQTLGTHKRIEQKASRELGMILPDPKKTITINLGSAAARPANLVAQTSAGAK